MTQRFLETNPTMAQTCASAYYDKIVGQGLAAHTLTAYRIAITKFLANSPEDPAAWKRPHVVSHFASLRTKGLADSTVAWHQRHLNAFFRWLFKEEMVSLDLSRAMPAVKVTQRYQRSLDETTFAALLTVASARSKRANGTLERPAHYYRNIALLRVLWDTGLRRNELSLVRLGDLDMGDAAKGGQVILVTHPKTHKERYVPFGSATKEALHQYIIRERGTEPGALFLSKTEHGPLTSEGMRLVLRILQQRAGVKVSSHDFRRGWAQRMRSSGMDIAECMNIGGWSNIIMVQRYSQIGESQAAIAKYRELVK